MLMESHRMLDEQGGIGRTTARMIFSLRSKS